MPPFSYAQVAAAGSAARAAAAEHNHGHSRSVNNAHDLDHSRFTAISLDRDEELSEADMHTFKRQRRSGKGKHVEEGDNGYDSMMDVDADMRDDEVMGGRRNVNPPPRRGESYPCEVAMTVVCTWTLRYQCVGIVLHNLSASLFMYTHNNDRFHALHVEKTET